MQLKLYRIDIRDETVVKRDSIENVNLKNFLKIYNQKSSDIDFDIKFNIFTNKWLVILKTINCVMELKCTFKDQNKETITLFTK